MRGGPAGPRRRKESVDDARLSDSSGLHDIWKMSNATTMASLSLVVVAVFAAALSAISVRVFARAALH